MSTKPENTNQVKADRDWQYDAPDGDGVEYIADAQPFEDGSDGLNKGGVPCGTADTRYLTPQQRIDMVHAERAEVVGRRRETHNPITKVLSYVVPYGGIVSSGFNLASSSIGAGIVSLGSAFNTSGLIMGVIYMVVIGLLTIYSHTLIATAEKRTGLCNYEQVVRATMGPGADYFLAFCLWFLSFGAEISYSILVGEVVKQFLTNASSTPAFLLTPTGNRLIQATIWLFAMLPLCLPKEINSLRYFSFLAIFFVIFFVICMIVHSAQNGLHNPEIRKQIVYFETGNTAIQGLSIFMFAFINQLNAAEVWGELYRPTIRRMTAAATLATVLCFTLYLFAGLFVYLDFGAAVTGSALAMYNPIKEPLMGVCYAMLLFKLCVGYGLHMIPVRDATYHFFQTDVRHVPWLVNAAVCTFWAVVSLVCGMFIPRVNMVFGLVGSLAGGFIGFVFPALMYMYSGGFSLKQLGFMRYFAAYFLLIVGVIGIVWGTAATIYQEVLAEQSS